jgi:hypothetical protein
MGFLVAKYDGEIKKRFMLNILMQSKKLIIVFSLFLIKK